MHNHVDSRYAKGLAVSLCNWTRGPRERTLTSENSKLKRFRFTFDVVGAHGLLF